MIRLAIIEDNATYSRALTTYLERVEDLKLVYCGSSMVKELKSLVAAKPDVVILDIDLGSESGIEGVGLIRAQLPETGVFMLTVFEDSGKIIDSLRAGARGYLLKKDPPEKIVEAIREVHHGRGAITSQVTNTLLDYLSKSAPALPSLETYGLTRRESEVAELLMQGLSYKEIASRAFISVDTLNSHVRKIYSKLQVHSRSEMSAKLQHR